jgi:hypothetical protein
LLQSNADIVRCRRMMAAHLPPVAQVTMANTKKARPMTRAQHNIARPTITKPFAMGDGGFANRGKGTMPD